jgi:undecaprenyl-diphosphatase
MPVVARRSLAALLLVLLASATLTRAARADTAAAAERADGGMTPVGAVVLGLVEGITEYLPVSSTGHLAVAQDLLGIGTGSEREKEAADAYAVVIQAGAILAVLLLYRQRVVSLVNGLLGRDDDGRRILVGSVIAIAPIAVVGVAFESKIKEALFGPGPVIAAWAIGGVVLLVLSARGYWHEPDGADGADGHEAAEGDVAEAGRDGRPRRSPLELITPRQAAVIGAAQVLALWPGTSRSLVTIVAGLAVGLTLAAAVEFSFLVGLATLSAATLVDGAKHGNDIVDVFGVANPAIGFAVAFLAAVVAVRWMVTYLQRHSLAVFGWYRLAAAAVVGALWATGTV